MGSLIGRTVAGVGASLAVLAMVLADDDGPTPETAAHYLEQTDPPDGAEAAWEVRRIEAQPHRMVVVLRVDDGAAAGFPRMADGARWVAFGPACPALGHGVWDRLPGNGDVEPRPASDDREVIMRRLSCRQWNARTPRG
jgi:hypothetical protein